MTIRSLAAALLLIGGAIAPLHAQGIAGDEQLAARVDSIATRILASTGVPSASVAVVTHGRVA